MNAASWVERAILVALVAASAAWFWRRLGKILDTIRRSRPTPDFALRPAGRRIRRFLWEVAAQGKTIRERPLPGIAHACVFWGFVAFAPVTLNHVAGAFGLRFLDPAGSAGSWYLRFAAAWAAAVAVAIAGLSVRRFVVRPRWLGAVSPESGVIALLIFLLMATYLGGLWIGDGAAGRACWWLHTAVLLAFLPLIPHTKHLHLALGPAAVFLGRDGFSRIPPLSGDEDFGLEAGRDLTRIDALQVYSCVECGRCTERCPANRTGKALDPKQIVLGLRRYLNEFGPAAEAPLLGTHISAASAFQCTTCGACEFQCAVGIQHLPLIVGLRRGAVNTGKWEDDRGARVFLSLERCGNPLGFPPSERSGFIAKSGLPLYDGSQEYCLWLGCMGAYDPHGRQTVLALSRVLRHAGVTFGVLRQEKCCGDPARRLGNDLAISSLAEANIGTLRAARVGRMVSICPHCVRTIGTDWKEFGATFRIEHHSELLSSLCERLPAPVGAREKAAFHDPCYLGRYRKVYDQPRRVVRRYAELTEPARTRGRSFCCGAGGGQMFLGEEEGVRMNAERARELAGTGARTIATACPFCQTMFRDALAEAPGPPPALLDIAQLAAAGLPVPAPPMAQNA